MAVWNLIWTKYLMPSDGGGVGVGDSRAAACRTLKCDYATLALVFAKAYRTFFD